MEATEKYREKYRKAFEHNPLRRTVTPAGHEDINKLCDAVEALKRFIEYYLPLLDPRDQQSAQDRLNRIMGEL